MKRIFLLLFVFNIVVLFSQDIDRSTYLFMTHNEAARHYFDTGKRDRHFVMEAHFIEKSYRFSRPELRIFTNDPTQYWILQIECNSNIPNLPRCTVIRVYYRRYPAPGGNNPAFIDYIEPINKRFIIGHAYSPFVNLNLRTEPSVSASRITTISKGTDVNILEEGHEETIDGINSLWVKVRLLSGQTGWVFGGYLEYWNMPPINYDELDW